MPHPEIDNQTPFELETLFLADEQARPLLVVVIKGTFDLDRESVTLADEQRPVVPEGVVWDPEAEVSSYRFEPESAFTKPSTDVALIGHAWAPKPGTTSLGVGFSVGGVKQVAQVFGERVWYRALGSVSMTKPQSFEKIPLSYERAFGGTDRTYAGKHGHPFEPRNPVGRGYRHRRGKFEEGVLLPNIENPRHIIRDQYDAPPPTGFGFTAPNWEPRARLAGTYDEAWDKTRKPLLPNDFNRRFFNAASPALIAPSYLKGDEPVRVMNASKNASLAFNLPGVEPPELWVQLRLQSEQTLVSALDTVVVDTDEDQLYLTWRAHLPLRDGPHDLAALEVACNQDLDRLRPRQSGRASQEGTPQWV